LVYCVNKNLATLFRTLGNPGFRERHWENVSNTVGFPVNGASNLSQILDMGLDEYVAKFDKVTRGRCYDHNFLRFLMIFGEKMAFVSKTNVMIKILHNLALF
jgi:hypothetical protein